MIKAIIPLLIIALAVVYSGIHKIAEGHVVIKIKKKLFIYFPTLTEKIKGVYYRFGVL